MKRILFLVMLTFVSFQIYAQERDLKQVLYHLEENIMNGDIESLKELTKYLDDTSFVQEFLGHHNYPNTARGVALRVIQENSLFTKGELKFDSTISAEKVLRLIKENKVLFDDLIFEKNDFTIYPNK